MASTELFTLLAGGAAGFLGALVGIGGGVLLVPILNSFLGLTFREATAISLMAVLATSSSSSTMPAGRRLLNPRLATFLLVFSVSGALAGSRLLVTFPERTYELVFGITAALIAVIMVARLGKRNVLPAGETTGGVFGGEFHDDDTNTEVAYHVKRLPLAAGVSFAAGVLASIIGIGGGIMIVPALNSFCGVPIRVAAATSVLMIGVTAIPGVAAHWAGGFLGDFHMAGAACIGVMAGFQLGLHVSPRAPVMGLKILMVVLVGAVAFQYLVLK